MIPTREHDERLLGWLMARRKGISLAKIAAADGVSRQLVHQQTEGVKWDDIQHCGPEVASAYWK
jgi:hypothetical protein